MLLTCVGEAVDSGAQELDWPVVIKGELLVMDVCL